MGRKWQKVSGQPLTTKQTKLGLGFSAVLGLKPECRVGVCLEPDSTILNYTYYFLAQNQGQF